MGLAAAGDAGRCCGALLGRPKRAGSMERCPHAAWLPRGLRGLGEAAANVGRLAAADWDRWRGVRSCRGGEGTDSIHQGLNSKYYVSLR